MPRPDGADWNVQLTGSYEQKSDVVSSDTVVTAGSILTLKNGANNFVAQGKQITAIILVSSVSKWKLEAYFYSQGNLMIYNQMFSDKATTAGSSGGGIVNTFSAFYNMRFTNADTVDITIKAITRGEVF